MTFLSYAQNCEDVLLWRVLGHIKNGFYIDVGANDPVEHSVTKAFYDAGWCGINIEPMPRYHAVFEAERPRDINLAIAAGAAEGSITLFDVPDVNGWASTERTVAEAHAAEGHALTEQVVPLRTLASVCAQYVERPVHFLKIDVEGFEGDVLRGMDFTRWRPWVLVIEATLPNSQVSNHESWEMLVTGHGYQFAWFDGLNRYYVAEEQAALAAKLTLQPNVFDDYISYHLDRAWRATEAARQVGVDAEKKAAQAAQSQWQAEVRADNAAAAASQAAAVADNALALSNTLSARLDEAHARLLDSQAQADQLRHERDGALASIDQLVSQAKKHEAHIVWLDGQLAAQADLLAQATQANEAQGQWALGIERELQATRASWSWRLTRPLRLVSGSLRALADGSFKVRAGGVLKRIVTRMTANERLRRLLIPVLLRLPDGGVQVTQVLTAIKQHKSEPPAPVVVAVPEALRDLPVSARQVLDDLQRLRRQP